MQPATLSQASLILEAFAHHARGAGEVLTADELVRLAAERFWTPDDVYHGVAFCLSYAWIEPSDSGDLRLTSVGENQISGLHCT